MTPDHTPTSTDSQPQGATPIATPQRVKFPTLGNVLAMLGIFLVSNILSFIAVWILTSAFTTKGQALTPHQTGIVVAFAYFLAMSLTLCGILFYRRSRGGQRRIARFSRRGLNPMLLLWGVFFVLAMGVVIEPLLNFLPSPPNDELGRGFWTILTMIVLAPLFEELICRGVILESLRAKYGVLIAWLGSSLFFGILHLQPLLVVNAFFVGLILGFIYIKSESLYATIILHAINNAVAYVLMSMGYENLTFREIIPSQTLYVLLYIGAATLCLVSGIMVYRTLTRLKAEEKKEQTA